jgi:hypothetical protein
MTDNDKLKQLNEDTFLAEIKAEIEGEEWAKLLWRVLADDFRIRRANRAILPQDKHRMIAHIRYDEQSPKRIVSEVKMLEDRDYGVITCVTTLAGQSGRFHNVKLFAREPSGDWQCVYWRVTRLAG